MICLQHDSDLFKESTLVLVSAHSGLWQSCQSLGTFFCSLPHLLLSPWGNIWITTSLVAFEELRALGLAPGPCPASWAWPWAAAAPRSLWVPKGFPAPRLEQDADPKPLHSLDFVWLDPGNGLGKEQALGRWWSLGTGQLSQTQHFPAKRDPCCSVPSGWGSRKGMVLPRPWTEQNQGRQSTRDAETGPLQGAAGEWGAFLSV